MKAPKDESISLDDPLSPVSWLILFVAVGAMEITVLMPRWWEYGVYFLAEILCNIPAIYLSQKLFPKFFPQFKSIFPKIEWQEMSRLSLEEKKEFLDRFFRFPGIYTYWCFAISILKGIPSVLLILFFFSYEHSLWQQLALALGIAFVNYFFFLGLSFIEIHGKISHAIHLLHEKFDWSDAFLSYKAPTRKGQALREISYIFYPAIFVSFYQVVSILLMDHFDRWHLVASVAVTGAGGLILFSRCMQLWRDFILKSTNAVFAWANQETPMLSQHRAPFALHSYVPVANFENSFNHMVERVHRGERELSVLVIREAEKARFQTLGEATALVTHDLLNPIHAAKFCLESLQEKPQDATKYISQALLQMEKCETLLANLRKKLRRDEKEVFFYSPKTAHQEVLDLLQIEFIELKSHKWPIFYSGLEENIRLHIPKVEFYQLLDNIYRNAFREFRLRSEESAWLKVDTTLTEHFFVLKISNSGPKLSQERFEELTGYGAFSNTQELLKNQHGLGLRLIRRLTEQFQGSVQISEGEYTCFLFQIPLAKE